MYRMRPHLPFSWMTQARHSLSLWLAILALAGQMALGAVVPGAAAPQPDDGLTPFTRVICHTGAAPFGGTPPQHGRSDCALCPLCFAASHAGAVLLPVSPHIGARAAIQINAYLAPPASAPPSRPAAIPYPTGPPRRA